MNKYILSCCSTVDLTLEHLIKRNINYISFHFYLDGKEYIDDLGKSLSYQDFYQALANGADTKTSQVNVDEFINYFKTFLDQGLDILHISTSYGISGAYNSAMLAKSILEEEYPNQKINIINSKAASSGYGLLMDKVADLKDAGLDIDDLTTWVEENKLNLNLWFTSNDLSFYVKGGRISKASGVIGTALKINPILTMDKEGKLIPNNKAVGTKRAYKRLLNEMMVNAQNGLGYCDKCYISHSNIEDDALKFAKEIEKTFPHLEGKVLVNSVGTTIGSHTGPGTMALFYWGKKRDN